MAPPRKANPALQHRRTSGRTWWLPEASIADPVEAQLETPEVVDLQSLADLVAAVARQTTEQLEYATRAALISAAAQLFVDSNIGGRSNVEQVAWATPTTSVLGFSTTNDETISSVITIAENDGDTPIKIAVQASLKPAAVDPNLYLSPLATDLVAEQGDSGEILVPYAAVKLARGERYTTTLWPGDRIFGLVAGFVVSKSGVVMVSRLSLRQAIQAVLDGNLVQKG